MISPSSERHAELVARSLLFNAAFYANLLIHMLVALPTFVLPQCITVQISRSWGATSLWLVGAICGIRVAWHGREKIPRGPLLVASKHPSAWETFALLPLFSSPTAIAKRELLWLPLFGWCMC